MQLLGILACALGIFSIQEGKPKLVEFAAEGGFSGPSQEQPASLRALESKKVSLNLRSVPLKEALESIAKQADVMLSIDRSFDASDYDPLTLKLGNVSASAALSLLAELYGLKIEYGADRPVVSRRDEGEEIDGLALRTYDVRDLTFALRDFPGGETTLLGGSVRSDGESTGVSDDMIVELIMNTIDRDGWEEEGRSLQVHDGVLLVRSTHAAHREIDGFLSRLRSIRNGKVRTEIRVVAMTEKLLAELRADGPSVGARGEEALEKALKSRTAGLLGAMEVVCFETQRVAPSTFRHGTFVSGGKPATPTVRATAEGLRAEIRPVTNRDRSLVTTELRLTLTDVRKVGEVEGAETKIQAPSGRTVRVRSTVMAPSGDLMIAASFAFFGKEDPRRAVVLMRTTALQAPGRYRLVSVPTSGRLERVLETRQMVESARTTLTGRGPTLTYVLSELSKACGVDVILDPRLDELDEARVTVTEDEKDVAQFLDEVSESYSLTWQVREGFVLVTGVDTPVEVSGLPVRIYEVSDLLYSLYDFPGPLLEPPSDEPGAVELLSEAILPFTIDERAITGDYLTEMIQESTGGESWDNLEQCSINTLGGMLVIAQTPIVHDEVIRLLDEIRARRRGVQVRTEVRVVTMDEELLRSLRSADGALDAKAEALLGKALASGAAHLKAAGELVCQDTQRAHVALVDVEHHVTAYRTVEKRAVPEVSPVRSGWVLDVKPVTGGDRRSVKVELRFSGLDRPTIRTLRTKDGPVAQPNQTHLRLETSLSIPSGRTVIAGSLGSFTEGDAKDPRRDVLLLRSTVIGVK